MTIGDIIKKAGQRRRGCDMSVCEYIAHLNTLESDIYANIISCHEGAPELKTYTGEEDTLLVPDMYADLYTFYLLARIDLDNGDTVGYTNNMILYNGLMSEFSRYYTRNRMPLQRASIGGI